jgi:MoxR-like ATPase
VALANGRGFVAPDDVRLVAQPVLAHRIALTIEAEIEGRRVCRSYTLSSTPTRPDSFEISIKRVVDVYGQWRFSAATALRLTVSNLLPRDYETATTFNTGMQQETARTTDRNWSNVQLRL